MAILSNHGGTNQTSYRIGLAGPTIKVGTADPTSGPLAGNVGDIYVRNDGGNEGIFQREASNWVKVLDTRGGFTTVAGATFGGVVLYPNGTAANPSVAFTNSPATGIYRSAANVLSIAANGVQVAQFTSTTTTITGDLIVQGSTITVDSSTVAVGDNTILLNKDEVGAGVTLGSAGIEVERGSLANVFWQFNESNDWWESTGVTTIGNLTAIDTTASGNILSITGNGALRVPGGTTLQRPGSPTTGMLRYESGGAVLEYWNGSSWLTLSSVSGSGFVQKTGDSMSGNLTMTTTATIRLINGTAGVPALTFDSDDDTGIYRINTNTIGFSANGTLALSLSNTVLEPAVPIAAVVGSASAPSYAFTGDSNTGIYHPNTAQVGIATSGGLRVNFQTANTIFTQTGSLALPAGTTAQRLGTTNGEIRYNSDLTALESRVNGQWLVFSVGTNAATKIGVTTNTVSGTDSIIVGGGNNTTAANYSSVVGGQRASAYLYGQNSRSSGRFSADGDAQISTLIARNSTTNGTPTLLFLDGASEKLIVPTDTSWQFTVNVIARRTDGGGDESAGYKLEGVIANDNGTTTIIGSVADTVFAEISSPWGVTVTANDTTDSLDISVTGEAAKTIRWVAKISIVETTG